MESTTALSILNGPKSFFVASHLIAEVNEFFFKHGSYRISVNQRVLLWYGWELRWIKLGCVRRPTLQEMKWNKMSEESRKQTFAVQPLCTYDCLFVIYTALFTVPQMIPNRKWSWDRKWSPDGPQMTLDRKWSLKSTPNDSVKTWGMEWILWDWLQKRTDYTKETFFSRLLKKKGRRTLQLRSIHTRLVWIDLSCSVLPPFFFRRREKKVSFL